MVVVHFADADSLKAWQESTERREWTAKLSPELSSFDVKTLGAGFSPWFGDLGAAPTPPAPWKMAFTVILALYPTVMLLTIFVGPHTSGFGLAVSMLIGNALSVVILQWGVMPVVERALRPWLRATAAGPVAAGTAIIVAVIGLLVWLFGLAS